MNIQPITNYSLNSAFTSKNKVLNYVTKPIRQDSFEHNNVEFDLDNSMKMLAKIKMPNGKNKFHKGSLNTLEGYLKEEPKKWDSIYKLANNPEMKGDFVYLIASKPLEQLNMLTQISEIKNEKGNHKYSGKEIMHFTDKLMPDELKKALPLTKTKMPVKNIVLTAQTKNIPSTEKIAEKVLEMEQIVGNDLKEISFTRNRYVKNEFVISAKMQNDNEKKVFLDKDLKKDAIEDTTSYTTVNGKKYFVKKSTDFRNNTTSKVTLRDDKAVGRPVFENEVRIVKDKNNKVKYYEYTSHSQVNGVYDIVRKTPKGEQKILSSGTIDKKTGIVSIKKDMTSPEGVRTQYLYENDPQGNRIVDYKITDKNGKILLNKSQTFEVINENKFISSKGNDTYEINVNENEISAQSLQDKNKKAKFTAKDNFIGDKKQLISTLKQFPGEELIKLSETVDFLESINDPLDSFYNGSCRSISTGADEFLFLHELGHARDYRDVDSDLKKFEETMKNSLTMDKDVNKAFEEEKKAFFKLYPDTQREHMDYFMNTLNHYGGETGGLSETIAESNAILSEGKSYEPLAIRSQYLQQNFPRTIAILETKLSK